MTMRKEMIFTTEKSNSMQNRIKNSPLGQQMTSIIDALFLKITKS